MAKVNGKPKDNGVPTYRFNQYLDLEGKDTFSEFSYALLVKERRKLLQQKTESQSSSFVSDGSCSGLPPASGPDDSAEGLAAIARKLEEKYAPKSSTKRKKLIHNSDYIDRGGGYDLEDPFVDDSETYEDFVPDHLETKHGGFYINTGRLEFKTSEDMHEIDYFIKNKPKMKKQPSHQTPQAILANQKLKKAKQHVALQKTPTGAKFNSKTPQLKKFDKKSSKVGAKPATGAGPVAPIKIGDKFLNVPILPSGGQPNSVLVSQSKPDAEGTNQEKIVEKQPPLLPPNLPASVLQRVNVYLEDVSSDQKKLSAKQREDQLQNLYEVELACRAISIKIRNAVFEYLAFKSGIARGTLTKRLKQFVKKKEETSLVDPLAKLKQAVEASMPKQLALFEEEVKKARLELSTLSEKSLPDVEEDTKTGLGFDKGNEVPSLGREGSSVSTPGTVDSASSTAVDQASGQPTPEAATTKAKRLPRKKYHWNDNEEVKKLLCEVTRIKVSWETNCSRLNKEKGEEVIMQFLEDSVRPFWPKGWMQKSILYKITEPVHRSYTSKLSQAKKLALVASAKKEKIVVKQVPSSSSPSKLVLSGNQVSTAQNKSVELSQRAIVVTTSEIVSASPTSAVAQIFCSNTGSPTILNSPNVSIPVYSTSYAVTNSLNIAGVSSQPCPPKQAVVRAATPVNIATSSPSHSMGHSVKKILLGSPMVSVSKFDLSANIPLTGVIKQASPVTTHRRISPPQPVNSQKSQGLVFTSPSSYLSPVSLTQQVTGALSLTAPSQLFQHNLSQYGSSPTVPAVFKPVASPVGIMDSKQRKYFTNTSYSATAPRTNVLPPVEPRTQIQTTTTSKHLLSYHQPGRLVHQHSGPIPTLQPNELSQGHSQIDVIKKEHCYSESSTHSFTEQRK